MKLSNPYKDMEGSKVIAQDSENLGKIFDFIVDQNFKLMYFVSRSGHEIFLIKPEQIEQSDGEVVRLKVPKRFVNLYDKAEHDWISFTTLRTKQVYDKDGENIGQILDVVFHIDNYISFIIGGKGLKRYLALLGFSADDMLVPYRYIKSVDQYNVLLHKSRVELDKMLKGHPPNQRTYLSIEAQQKSSEEIEIQLQRDSYVQLAYNR